MKKLTLICFGLINAFLLTACSSNNNNSSNGSSTATWHNENAPFMFDGGNYVSDNVLAVNVVNGLNNGRRYFVMPGNGTIWLNNDGKWTNVTPADSIMSTSDDFLNFNVDPTGQDVVAFTTNHELLYFNGSTWSNAGVSSCLTDPSLVSDFAINEDLSTATILGSNGTICQYNTKSASWTKANIAMSEDDAAAVALSSYGIGNALYVFNSNTPSLTYFSDLSKAPIVIPNPFNAADELDVGQDHSFVTNFDNNRVVLFSNTKNDFYYYANESWNDTQLDLATYGATDIVAREYYFDSNNQPYIFAVLDNMKVILYAQGKWQATPIKIPSDATFSDLTIGISTSSIRASVEYQVKDINDNKVYQVLYDYGLNKVIDLNDHEAFVGMFGSSDLHYIYGLDDKYNLYLLNLATGQWENTNFKITNYGNASGISTINVTNDGVAVVALTNGAIASYYR